MRELSSDLKVILKKFNVYIKGIARMLLKRKSMFFYGFEVREIRWLSFLDSISKVSPGIFSECLKTCLSLRCRWEMMRIPVQGIKEKRGIIYKALTARGSRNTWRQRGGKGVYSFWIVTPGQKIHMSKFIRQILRVKTNVPKCIHCVRLTFISSKYKNLSIKWIRRSRRYTSDR